MNYSHLLLVLPELVLRGDDAQRRLLLPCPILFSRIVVFIFHIHARIKQSVHTGVKAEDYYPL